MAQPLPPLVNTGGINEEGDPASGTPTWGDYGRSIAKGAMDLDASLNQAARWVQELKGADDEAEYFGAQAKLSHMGGEEFAKGMTPAGRSRLETEIMSGKFLEHPFSSIGLKLANMAPSTAAALMVLPAASGVVSASLLAAAGGGTLSAAQMLDDYYSKVDELSDKDLIRQSAVYAGYRASGMSEAEARREFNIDNLGAKPILATLFGGVANSIGPVGQIGRALVGKGASVIAGANRGVLARTGAAAMEGAASEFMDEAQSNYLAQHALVQGQLQEKIDTQKVLSAGVEGAVLGAVMGAPIGAVAGRAERRADERLNETLDYARSAQREAMAGPALKAAGTGIAPKPPTDIEVGDPQNKVVAPVTPRHAAGRAAVETSKRRSKEAAPATPVELPPDITLAAANNAGTPAVDIVETVTASIEQAKAINAQAQEALTRFDQVRQTPDVIVPPVTPGVPLPATDAANAAGQQMVAESDVARLAARAQPVAPTNAPMPIQGVTEVATPPVQRTSTLPTAPISAPIEPAPAPVAKAVPQLTDDQMDARARERAAKAIPTVKPTPAEKKNLKAQEKAQLAALAPPKEIAEVGKEHAPGNEIKARATRERAGRMIMSKYKPQPNETLQQTAERAAAIVGHAQKLFAGIPERNKPATRPAEPLNAKRDKKLLQLGRIPKKLVDQELSAPMTLMAEAEKLMKALGNKKLSAKKKEAAVHEFRLQEGSVRKGYVAEVRQDRKKQAEEALAGKIGLKELMEDKVEAKEGGVGGAVEEGAKLELSPEEIVLAKEEAGIIEGRDRPMTARVAAMTTEEKFATPVAPKTPVVVAKKDRFKRAAPERPKLAALLQKHAPAEITRKAEPRKPPKKGAALEVAGLAVTISHRKGEARNGVEEIPANYGEIKGVKGADGDNLDAWFGPKAWPGKANKVLQTAPVFVIDQLDVETRKFDEHKVMLGFNHVDQALSVYDKSFADGRGAERVGNVKAMTWDQFKTWLEEGDQAKPVARQALRTSRDFPAYHGSRHRFFKFLTDKIGTGQGAQTYGWGLYFGKKRDVAESYRNTGAREMGDHVWRINGKQYDPYGYADYTVEDFALSGDDPGLYAAFKLSSQYVWMGKEASIEKAIQDLNDPSYYDDMIRSRQAILDDPKRLAAYKNNKMIGTGLTNREYLEGRIAELEITKEYVGKVVELLKTGTFEKVAKGNLYTVDIKVDESKLLDWDKPLRDQSIDWEKINEKFNQYALPEMTGEELYNTLVNHYRRTYDYGGDAKKAASKKLLEVGIPGLKFLDQFSRSYERELERAKRDVRYEEGHVNQVKQHLKDLARMRVRDLRDKLPYADTVWKAEKTRLQNDLKVAEERVRQAKLDLKAVEDEGETHNIVMFSDDKIDILDVNGEAITKAESDEIVAKNMRGEEPIHSEQATLLPPPPEGSGEPMSTARIWSPAKNKNVDMPVVETGTIKRMREVLPKFKGPLAIHENLIYQVLMKAAGDVPVHIVTHEVMAEYNQSNSMGFYDYVSHSIILHVDWLDTRGAHTLLHELVHAATSARLEDNPVLVKGVEAVMQWALEADPFLRKDPGTKYGFKDAHEFLAEAMSNPYLQTHLMAIKLTPEQARALGLAEWKVTSAWGWLVETVRRITGLPRGTFTALDAAMRMTEKVSQVPVTPRFRNKLEQWRSRQKLTDDIIPRVEDFKLNTQNRGSKALDFMASVRQLGYRAKAFGKEFGDIYNKFIEFWSMLEREKFQIIEKEGGLKLVATIAKFVAKHGMAKFRAAADLAFDASNMNVNLGPGADNSHLGKDKTKGWQAKARLPALQARYNTLDADAREMLQQAVAFFRSMQNEISKQLIRNVLDATLGKVDEALVDRIHTDGLTDADRAMFETDSPIRLIADARSIKQLKGWYFPFRRYGNYVVTGRETLKVPKGAIQIDEETVQFTGTSALKTRRAAKAYASGSDLTHIGTKHEWVDVNDHTKILEKEDPNAIHAYRVRLQTQYTSFHDDLASATRETEALRADGLTMAAPQERRNLERSRASLMSYDMKAALASLEKQERFKNKSQSVQDAIKQAMFEASIRMMGSTRLQSQFIQRRNVAGMSTDLSRVTADYVRVSSGYLARLRYAPLVEREFDRLEEYVSSHAGEKANTRRSQLVEELRRRYAKDVDAKPDTGFAKFTRRALQLSRLDKLAGVSYHLINAQEPWIVSLPVIGGRHGFGAATYRLGEAYRLIGATKGAISGLTDTYQAYHNDLGFTDYVAMFGEQLRKSPALGPEKAARLVEVLEYLRARGMYSDEAIFEVSRFADPTGNRLARAIDRADLMANQVGSAVEKINRSVTALAAYQLEYGKNGGNHEAAMAYAFEVTHDTMGDYSTWNASAVFQHDLGKLAFQFKKYGQKTYFLLGKTIARAMRGDTEALKQFGGLMLSHMLVAGALGLPLEPIRAALLAAGVFGLGFTWGDVEEWARRRAREMLGAKGGELFTRGLTRMIGIDTSGRMGLDQLVLGKNKEPNANSKTEDIKAFFFDTFAGAPAGYLIDQVKALQSLQKGEKLKAAEQSVPIKAFADLVKAARGYSEGIKTQTGRERMKKLGWGEAAAQAVGFTPARVAEQYEMERNFYGKRDRLKAARTEMILGWVNASPADKRSALTTIKKWNVGRPKAEQITMADLERSMNARDKDKVSGMVKDGIRATSRERHLLADSPYNIR